MENKTNRLTPEQLYTHCDLSQFTFNTTDDIDAVIQIVGQEKAVDAIKFGISIPHEGYNIFVLGPHGAGKFSTVSSLLGERAAKLQRPDDWGYVFNFDQPHRPRAIRFPNGQGAVFARDMDQLIVDLRHTIPGVFNSDDYQSQLREIEQEFKDREEQAIDEVRQEASAKQIALVRTTSGFAFAAVQDNEIVKPKDYDKLSQEQRSRIEADIDLLQEKLQKVINQLPQWRAEAREKVRSVTQRTASKAVSYPISQLRQRYNENAKVVDYLERVEQDIVENIGDFRSNDDADSSSQNSVALDISHTTPFYRYKVNLFSHNGSDEGAPVVYEDHPTHQHLVGRIEHVAMMGALLTDFRLIKPGALHRANQGFLVLDAYKILSNLYAWDGLKRALQSKEIRIQSLEQLLSLVSTVSLEPECIPLSTKVVLLGDRYLYYLMYQLDPDFCELFKVAADFDETVQRIPENVHQYVNLIATLTKQYTLRGLLPEAVGRIIEQCSRMAEDSLKLSTHLREITDLLRESDYWAGERGSQYIAKQDVEKTLQSRELRTSRIKMLHLEAIERRIQLIDSTGARVGVVNGLSIFALGDVEFASPTRITATVRMGEGDVINIDREVELSGPIHSKGVFILSSFLGTHYGCDYPLSLSANLVFEQSYGTVEGDSASSSELLALLSALSGVPIKQSIGVTGSVNQFGEIQAIGGVNLKIEGFFDVCKAQGLSGEQGVLIPASNVNHLMLREEIIQAVRDGQFHIYTMSTINEGIAILTGCAAGKRSAKGAFPEGSVNYLVEQRLIAMAMRRHDFMAGPKDDGEIHGDG